MVDPATVANPADITACNSDFVISGRNGRIKIGASDCKTYIKRLFHFEICDENTFTEGLNVDNFLI